ncbi:MAG TPA: RDD family protein [Mucilaginibacter sp.]|nr:RDD family protein [Mucilaginibacter sp.]
MQTIRITTSQNVDIDYEVAGLGERILGRLIDLGILAALYFAGLFGAGIAGALSGSDTVIIVLLAIYGTIFVFYDLVFEILMNGQSIGKRIMKIKVISLDGAQPRVGQYLLRWLFRIVDFLLFEPGVVALVAAAVNEKTQRVGDMVAGTLLIRTSPRTKSSSIVFMPVNDGYQPVFSEAGRLNDRDIELIHEVIQSYIKTGNNIIVYRMALKVKEHLGITPPQGMNDMSFLQTIIKDYNHISSQADIL